MKERKGRDGGRKEGKLGKKLARLCPKSFVYYIPSPPRSQLPPGVLPKQRYRVELKGC